MRKVCCHDCGKRYDFDVDDFCPRCGSFTQPVRPSRIGSDGEIVYESGINERNHRNSFLHEEFHEENEERRGSALEGHREYREPAVAVQSYAKRLSDALYPHESRNPAAGKKPNKRPVPVQPYKQRPSNALQMRAGGSVLEGLGELVGGLSDLFSDWH